MYYLIILFILICVTNIFTLNNNLCYDAPDNDTRKICEGIQRYRNVAKKSEKENDLEKFSLNEIVVEDAAALNDIIRPELECLTLNCYCSYLGGISNGSINDCTLPNGKKLKKAIRKELRMLTDEERNEIFAAIREMKNNGDYDYIALVHRDAVYSGCAHGGQAFFLFHREYTKRFEILLRKRNPTLFLPYWDSTLESRLPNPEDSILFTDLFMGTTNSNGYVTTGPFTPWQTLDGNPYISRNLGQEGRCFNEDDINWILAQTQIENILSYTLLDKGCPYKQNWRWCEFIHGKTHRLIGGDMAYIEQSANDPLFMKFHCFVDYLLEIWRQKQQNREQRVTEYPKDLSECTPVCHFKNATMSQFAPLKNADGLRNEYTDNLYEYAPRPTCTNSDIECGSKYLFCDLSHDSPHCAAKVKPGGNCKGFNNGEQVCFNSTCQSDGICVFEMQNIETTSIKIQNQKEITTLNAKTSLENETTSKQFNKQLNLEKETSFEYTTKITKEEQTLTTEISPLIDLILDQPENKLETKTTNKLNFFTTLKPKTTTEINLLINKHKNKLKTKLTNKLNLKHKKKEKTSSKKNKEKKHLPNQLELFLQFFINNP